MTGLLPFGWIPKQKNKSNFTSKALFWLFSKKYYCLKTSFFNRAITPAILSFISWKAGSSFPVNRINSDRFLSVPISSSLSDTDCNRQLSRSKRLMRLRSTARLNFLLLTEKAALIPAPSWPVKYQTRSGGSEKAFPSENNL